LSGVSFILATPPATRPVFTFAPGVEQQVDVVGRVAHGDALAAGVVRLHRELVAADGGGGGGVHRQQQPAAVPPHHGGRPAVVLQLVHQGDDDVSSL